MNYTVLSNTGYRTGAHTQTDAIAKAKAFKQEWNEANPKNTVVVDVYYVGEKVFSTKGGI